MTRKDILTPLLYCLSLVAMASVQLYLFIVFFDYIYAGLGVGIFAVYGYALTLVLASAVWLVSFRRKKNFVGAAVYWLTALAIVPILLTQPIWWSAPPIN